MSYTLSVDLPSEADTQSFGRRLAHLARTGDVFALYGTLGMGKSVLARAFIQELTGTEEVPSPTFTLLQTYEAAAFEIYHFDLYRLKNPEEIFEIGVEEAMYQGVSLIEWPERMQPYLPRDYYKIELTPQENGRHLQITCFTEAKAQRLLELEAKNDN